MSVIQNAAVAAPRRNYWAAMLGFEDEDEENAHRNSAVVPLMPTAAVTTDLKRATTTTAGTEQQQQVNHSTTSTQCSDGGVKLLPALRTAENSANNHHRVHNVASDGNAAPQPRSSHTSSIAAHSGSTRDGAQLEESQALAAKLNALYTRIAEKHEEAKKQQILQVLREGDEMYRLEQRSIQEEHDRLEREREEAEKKQRDIQSEQEMFERTRVDRLTAHLSAEQKKQWIEEERLLLQLERDEQERNERIAQRQTYLCGLVREYDEKVEREQQMLLAEQEQRRLDLEEFCRKQVEARAELERQAFQVIQDQLVHVEEREEWVSLLASASVSYNVACDATRERMYSTLLSDEQRKSVDETCKGKGATVRRNELLDELWLIHALRCRIAQHKLATLE